MDEQLKSVAALLTQTIVSSSTSSDFRGETETVKKSVLRVYREVLKELQDDEPPKKRTGKGWGV